jgi:putative transposase
MESNRYLQLGTEYRFTADQRCGPDHIAVDETVIQVNNERHWLYAAVDPETNEFLHVRFFSTRTTQLTVLFLREHQQIVPFTKATILVDDAHHLRAAPSRLGLRFQMGCHGNRNAVERVSRDIRRRKSSFSNIFSHAQPTTVERWLQAFVVWWNDGVQIRMKSEAVRVFLSALCPKTTASTAV